MLGLGAAAVGAAGEAVKAFGDMQAANTRLATSAGENANNLKADFDGVLKMSVDTATSTSQLEQGLYILNSAGFHGKAGLDALAAAAKGAKTENADLSEVTNAESTIMVDYASKHVTAAQAVNDLIATVSRGKTNLQDLSSAFSTVLPTSNAVGVSLYDTSGAMATMTAEGTDAASAATYLRQLLIALEAPGSKAAGTLKDIGLTTAQVSDEMKKSLPDTLAMIEDHLKAKFPEGSAAYVEALKNIAGGSRQMQGILELTGTHLKTFSDNVKAVSSDVQAGGTQIDGFALAQKNLNFQLDQAHAALDAVFIKVGQELAPAVSQFISQDVMPAITHFEEWEGQTHGVEDAFSALTTVVGTVIGDVETLVSDIANFAQGLEDSDPKVLALAGGIAAVGTAIGLVKFEEWAAGLFNGVQKLSAANGFIAGLADKALPELGQALGWTTAAAKETGDTIAAIAPTTTTAAAQARTDIDSLVASFASVDEAAAGTDVAIESVGGAAASSAAVVDTASLSMTASLGIATAGVSVLIGLLAVGLVAAAGKAGQSLQLMTGTVKKDFDSLGTSAADNQAKIAAQAQISSVHLQDYWTRAQQNAAVASANTRAQMILDQQKIADAAEAAAQRADDAWVQASRDMNLAALYRASGYTSAQVKQLTGGGVYVDPGGGPTQTGPHAAGGIIGPGERGTVAEPGTGGEIVEGLAGGGARVYTNAQSRAMLGGGSSGGGGYGPLYLTLELDGRAFAAVTVPHIAPGIVSHLRLKTGVRI